MQRLFFGIHSACRLTFVGFCVLAFAAACQKEDFEAPDTSWPLVFSTSVQDYDGLLTKAQLYNTGTTNQDLYKLDVPVKQFKTYAYKANSTALLWAEIDMPLTVNYDGSWGYQSKDTQQPTKRVHPGATFFAYAPVNDVDGSGAVVSQTCESSGMTLTYSVPTNPADQKDVMIGYFKASTKNEKVAMKFYHPFVAVRFEMGLFDDAVKSVESVSITGVYQSGTVKLTGLDGSDPQYENTHSPSTQTVTCSPTGSSTFGNMVLLPQSSVTRMLQVTCKLTDGSTKVYSRPIDDKWENGHLYTYKIGSYIMELSTKSATLDVNGTIDYQGNFPTSLYYKSYRSYGSNTALVPWTMQFSFDQNTWYNAPEDWIDQFSVSGTGYYSKSSPSRTAIGLNTSPNQAAADIMPSHAAQSYNWSAAKGTSSAPYNLATLKTSYSFDGANTANCYIVNGPGYYCFPLVYGNALLAGNVNPESAYSYNSLYTLVTNNQPYIYENSLFTVGTAELLWCDGISPSCIQNVKLQKVDGKDKYLCFQVTGTLTQGNVLLAVKDTDGNIVWSWHIWITDKDLHKVSNGQYEYLNANLGQIDKSSTLFGAGSSYTDTRTVYLRLQSNDAKAHSNIVTLTQQTHTASGESSSPVYQFQRKDPFPENPVGADGKTFELLNLPILSQSQIGYINDSDRPRKRLAYSVKHPDTMLTEDTSGANSWWGNDYTYNDMWGNTGYATTSEDENVFKTIFDPCPYGYRVMSYCEMNSLRKAYFSTPLESNETGVQGLYFKDRSDVTAYKDDLFAAAFYTRDAKDGHGALINGKKLEYWSSRPTGRYNYVRALFLYSIVKKDDYGTRYWSMNKTDDNRQGFGCAGVRPAVDTRLVSSTPSVDPEPDIIPNPEEDYNLVQQ